MIELEVPKDIRKYEAKLFGPFTTRQLICFVIAITIAFIVYKVLGNSMPQDVTVIIILVIVLPVLLCGWFKPYGMAFEKFVKVAFLSTLVSPAKRKYVSENEFLDKEKFDKLANVDMKKAIKNQKKRPKSKDPNMIAYR